MPSVTVYCSSSPTVDRKYLDAARRLGEAIAAAGWTLVYGGNFVGSMGALADGARSRGGRVVGITPQHFIDAGCGDADCDELLVAEDMRHRKHLLSLRADAFVALPGGIGTLEELVEILVARQLGFHAKPIVLVDIDGFWQPFLDLLERGREAGFVRAGTAELMRVVPDVGGTVAVLRDGFASG